MKTGHRRIVIGVMGGSSCSPEVYQEAYEVGRLIARQGAILLCGGRTGVMEAAAKGAKEEGGFTVGIMPGSDECESPPNPFIDLAIFTGMADARNAINVRSSDAVIALWGGYGTLAEIALALKIGKPVILLHSWRFEIEPAIFAPGAIVVQTAHDAVAEALRRAGSKQL